MKRIYISIPVTGYDLPKVREHADFIKMALSRKGYVPVNPLDIYPCEDPTYNDYIVADIKAMLGCDGVYFCQGWERSCGCNIEHDIAMRMKAYGKKDFKIMYEY